MVGPQQTLRNDTELFEILSHRDRRHALDLMTGDDREWSLDELADDIAGRERDGAAADEGRSRRGVRMGLYHMHLPMLAAGGLIEFDRDGATATLTPLAGTVDDRLFAA